MESAVHRTRVDAPGEEVERWLCRPGAQRRLVPPWSSIRVESAYGEWEPDTRLRLRMELGPFDLGWTLERHARPAGLGFRDRQRTGPFRDWERRIRLSHEGEGSLLEERVEYRLPGGAAGRLASGSVRQRVRRALRHRGATVAGDLRALGRAARARSESAPLAVAVTGSSGLVGSALVAYLRAGDHRVVRLVRRAPSADDEVRWRPQEGLPEPEALAGIDAVVHLAGEPLVGLWTEEKREAIVRSRVAGTRALARDLAGVRGGPRVLVSASAIGFYGDRGEEELTEESEPGSGFLAEVCRKWEGATRPAEESGIRVARLRLGLVLTPAGGALAAMLPAFRLGLGAPLGSGDQFVPWITRDDLLDVILAAVTRRELEGPVNAVAPHAVRNRELSLTLGRVLSRPVPFRLPGPLLRAVGRGMAEEMLLASARVRPRVLEQAGHRFRHPELEAGLRHVLGRHDQA